MTLRSIDGQERGARGSGERAAPGGGGLTGPLRPVLRLAGWIASLPLLYKILLSSCVLAGGTVVFAVWVTSEHIAESAGGIHWGIAGGLIVAGLGVVIAINFVAMRIAVRPIQALAEAMERVGRGAYDTRAAKHRVSDSQIEGAIDAFNRMAQSLEEQRQQLVRLSSQVLAAEDEERKRVARELHDDTGQALTTILVGLRGLESARGRREVAERVRALREVVAGAMQGVRRLARALRPAVLDDLGLAPAIASLVQDLREHTEIVAEFEADGVDQRLSPQTEVVLYRIAQEALTNVARHGQARRVLVSLARDGHLVRLSVEDDGVGFDVPSRRTAGGLGLFGMQERLSLVGGSLRIHSRPGEGTRVVAQVP
ncbi:MAG: hypothetical protein A2Z17_04140, partial [Gammaproteobacteria bacterium RBG_16_66_13]